MLIVINLCRESGSIEQNVTMWKSLGKGTCAVSRKSGQTPRSHTKTVVGAVWWNQNDLLSVVPLGAVHLRNGTS